MFYSFYINITLYYLKSFSFGIAVPKAFLININIRL